jgi:hypothetical protein
MSEPIETSVPGDDYTPDGYSPPVHCQACAAKDQRIAALEALLERMTHQIDEHRAGDYPPGHEPCSHDCPACAWEAMCKKEVR